MDVFLYWHLVLLHLKENAGIFQPKSYLYFKEAAECKLGMSTSTGGLVGDVFM